MDGRVRMAGWWVVVLAVVLSVGAGAWGAEGDYEFINIVDSTGPLSWFSYGAAINNERTLAFWATVDNDDFNNHQIMYTGSGGPLTAIAEADNVPDKYQVFDWFDLPATLNDDGTVAFWASTWHNTSVVATGNGGPVTTLIPSAQFGGGVWPWINNEGAVAFKASKNGGGGGIYVDLGGVVTTIVERGVEFPFVGNYPSINDNGMATFYAQSAAGGFGIFAGNGGPVTTIVDTSGVFDEFGSFPLINDAGVVAFRATLDDGDEGIFTISDGVVTTIAATSGPFDGWGTWFAMNNSGTVAFVAGLDTWEGGIFVGPDPVADKVIMSGDELFGMTAEGLWLGRQGINDHGDVAFMYSTEDRVGIAVARRKMVLGDTDGDGDVDFDDFLAVQNFFGDGGPESAGDADGDGDCDFDDFLAVNNFSETVAGPGASFVPEPGTLALMGLGGGVGLMMLRRNHRYPHPVA